MLRTRGILAVTLLSSGLCSAAASAATLYDSGGFELPRFTTAFVNPLDPTVVGNLRGQDTAVNAWREATNDPNGSEGAATGTAVVETKAGGTLGDAQDVKVTRTNYDDFWSPTLSYTQNAANPVVNISWSENVTQTTTNPNNYGPFFGIEGFDRTGAGGTPVAVSGLGVDSTTGEVLIEDPNFGGLNIDPNDDTVKFGVWNTFTLSLNYATKTATYIVNGSTLGSISFYDTSAVALSDADITAGLASATDFNSAGTAYFDNYVVSTPEPMCLSLLGLGGMALMGRRRSSR